MKKMLLAIVAVIVILLITIFIFNGKDDETAISEQTATETVKKQVTDDEPTNTDDTTNASINDEDDEDTIEMHVNPNVPQLTEAEKETKMVDGMGKCAVKGYVGENGVKVALPPTHDFYTVIESDSMFCSIAEAEEKGYIYYGSLLNGDTEAREQGVITEDMLR